MLCAAHTYPLTYPGQTIHRHGRDRVVAGYAQARSGTHGFHPRAIPAGGGAIRQRRRPERASRRSHRVAHVSQWDGGGE